MELSDLVEHLQLIVQRQDLLIRRYEMILLCIGLVSSAALATLGIFLYQRFRQIVAEAVKENVNREIQRLTSEALGEALGRWESRFKELDVRLSHLLEIRRGL